MGIGIVQGVAEVFMGIGTGNMGIDNTPKPASPSAIGVLFILNVISNVVSIFLGLGAARIGLRLVSGEPTMSECSLAKAPSSFGLLGPTFSTC